MSAQTIRATWNDLTVDIPEMWMIGFVQSHTRRHPDETHAQALLAGVAHWIHQEQLEREHDSHARARMDALGAQEGGR